ncbi:MAG: DUF434 domain-containing protein [Spirochaetales bacterium]|nr:DUF434 domain-containing protein [Spirochaetales bacterium]
MQFKNDFILACQDYYYLLNKGYAVKSSLKIVGDRYELSSIERNILLRGISQNKKIEERKAKTILENQIENKKVHIDGYNLLFTISNYYNGDFCFISLDGFVRDCANIGGRNKKRLNYEKTTSILLLFLIELKPQKCLIYFDEPVSKSKEDIELFKILLSNNKDFSYSKDLFDLLLVRNPDTVLSKINSDEIIVTSDSVIIDKTDSRIFDIFRWYFNRNKIRLFSLEDFLVFNH